MVFLSDGIQAFSCGISNDVFLLLALLYTLLTIDRGNYLLVFILLRYVLHACDKVSLYRRIGHVFIFMALYFSVG